MMADRQCRSGVLGLMLLAAGAMAHADGVNIERGVLTDRVDRGARTYGQVLASPMGLRPLSLWTLFRGTREQLEQMKNDPNGQLRLRHVWRRYTAAELVTEHDQLLVIGSKQDLPALENEVNLTGFFTWRTWSDKQQIGRGNWRVDVLWEDDEPVLCNGKSGERACSFPFSVVK